MAHWKAMEWQTAVDAASGIRVYRLTGVLTDSRDAYTLIEQVRAEVRSDPHPVLLNLAEVEQLTSAGVGMVATLYTSAQNAKSVFALCGPTVRTRHLLEIVHLLQFIPVFDNEAEALVAFARRGWEPVK